jgi:hypothetical protein
MTMPIKMKLIQDLATSGARAVECFVHDSTRYLVIPQLATDVPGQPALMTVGNSDTDALIYKWTDEQFVLSQTLPTPGGEDAEFFTIGKRAFLAMASLRSGSGPYDLNAQSVVYEFVDGRLESFQSFPTFAAKQWKHFQIGQRHFLAMAQGVTLPGPAPVHSPTSIIFEWDGRQFKEFQQVKSGWGYNWHFFECAGQYFLAYADHAEGSQILRWTGSSFTPFQLLEGKSGRAFCFFEHTGTSWLAFACLHDDTVLYQWNGTEFVNHQVISGPGGREVRWIPDAKQLVLINFLHGTREQPLPSLMSFFYRFENEKLVIDQEFATLGATDATFFVEDDQSYLVVAHSLSADVRFRTDSKVYQLSGDAFPSLLKK